MSQRKLIPFAGAEPDYGKKRRTTKETVLAMAAAGTNPAAIAEHLDIQVSTVEALIAIANRNLKRAERNEQ